jgi:hypothetical protein
MPAETQSPAVLADAILGGGWWLNVFSNRKAAKVCGVLRLLHLVHYSCLGWQQHSEAEVAAGMHQHEQE